MGGQTFRVEGKTVTNSGIQAWAGVGVGRPSVLVAVTGPAIVAYENCHTQYKQMVNGYVPMSSFKKEAACYEWCA